MFKKNINLTIIVSLLIIFILSATYAYVELTASANTGDTDAGCFVVEYESGPALEDLSIQSSAGYVEVQSTSVFLHKNADCQIYKEAKINLHTDLTIDNAAPLCLEEGAEGYNQAACSMKYMVKQGDDIISEGTVMAETEQELASIELSDTKTEYKIYIWIDSNTSGGLYSGKEYSGYIYATSIQSSTIKE